MSSHQSPVEARHGAQAPEVLPQHGLDPDDAWQTTIGAYLAKRCDMRVPEIFEVLVACEYDEVTRMRYLRLARGSQ